MQVIETIKHKLRSPLPGSTSQYKMAPMGRRQELGHVSNYIPAAVLSLLFPRKDEWHMVFIERTSHEKDKHSAQIAFPGGRVEDQDASYIDAAIREAEEEIGVDPKTVNVLGELTPLKIPVSGFEVFPVIGFMNIEPQFTRQVSEVERVIEVPLNKIVNPASRQTKEIKLSSGIILKDVPIFKFDQDIIWGATSMMLNEIIEILT